ncbi:hypothetical protein [Sphingomonas paeninsulae]|nr:hypothetical protein [Sphingomonas paeninsulae]
MFGSPKDVCKAAAQAIAIIAINPMEISFSQPVQTVMTNSSGELHYADVVDLYGAAPVALRARIKSATRIKDAVLPAGINRFYIEADVIALIRGPGVPPHLTYIVDLPLDSRGRVPKLKGADVLVAALPVRDRPGELQLTARDAQMMWTASLDAQVRSVITAVLAPDAAPVVTGVGSAFHVAGSIPGEGETQIFLTTANGAPVSLSILRRPGQEPRWALALGEIVDEAAGPPAKDTLPWYRLACFLPHTLPDAAVTELAAADANAAREDYAFVIARLGVCERTRR